MTLFRTPLFINVIFWILCYAPQRHFYQRHFLAVRRSSRQVGKSFEGFAANLFRHAGYAVILSPRSRGPFDFLAMRDGVVCYAVQVKTGQRTTAPDIVINDALAVALPDSATRLYWYRCAKYDRHDVWEITPTGLRRVPHPLAHRLPPPLDKNTINRQRRAHLGLCRATG